ncbi:MAG: (2Fe-2S)-binding protein [Beijerinckiaceae bacterium]|jgi:aerobic-type carbon monoxide dehydrogenase small subunit (CoxS/CutS family)
MPVFDHDGHTRAEVSRRSFLRGSAVTTAGVSIMDAAFSVAGHAEVAQSNGPPAAGPGPAPIVLTINGVAQTLSVEPRMTLAEALRGPLGLTGTKIACDRGACSACTVWLDGMTVCSCMLLAIDVGTRSITTIEGLALGETLHPVQAAFIEHDALQCGFCTPGMVMSCAALLERVPEPTDEDVRAAISGHICRCGTYPHVVAATIAASKSRKA